jgi:subtilisin-like proprotein convertase family protein
MLSTFSYRLTVRLIQLALLAGLAIVLAGAPRASWSAQAITWYVAPSGSDLNNCLAANAACEHIQTTINRATSGDTIVIVAPPPPYTPYYETLEISNKSLTLKGQGAATTIIDGNLQGTVLNIISDAPRTVTISGLTLRNGKSNKPGGGLSAESYITLNVLDCQIINNKASHGGGIFNQGFLTLNNVLLDSNQADVIEGGGIWNTGSGDLIGVTLINNVASRGGGISNLNIMTVTGSLIGDNQAIGLYGGGIYNRGGASQLTLINSTVSGNQAIGTDGGGIYNDHILVSSGSTISGNLALSRGGGVYNSPSGQLTFSDSSIQDNTSRDEGGALFNVGTATIDSTRIRDNETNKAGGGVYNGTSGQLTIETSAISNNTATGLQGGGIDNLGTLTLRQSALTYNAATVAQGGGLHNTGTAGLTNVTISDNTATGGSGIQNDGGAVQIKFSTISNNTSSPAAPALNRTDGTVTIDNSIVSQNSINCSGSISSLGYNIDYSTSSMKSCGFSVTGDLSGNDPKVDPQLGALQDNGGGSLTRAIAFGSSARDKAGTCPSPAVDQRTIDRPQGPSCDRGAYEVIGYSGGGGGLEPNQCVSTMLTINDDILIGRAQVGVNLTYANRADLTINIYASNNRKVTLLDPTVNPGANLDTLFDDNASTGVPLGDQDTGEPYYTPSYRPTTPLAQLRNVKAKGDWKLEVCNNTANSGGTLTSWVIVVAEVAKPKVYLPLIRRSK